MENGQWRNDGSDRLDLLDTREIEGPSQGKMINKSLPNWRIRR